MHKILKKYNKSRYLIIYKNCKTIKLILIFDKKYLNTHYTGYKKYYTYVIIINTN